MHSITNTELSSREETRFEFNRSTGAIKLGIDVHQDFYVVVEQVGGTNPKPPQRFHKQAFLHWAAKLKEKSAGAEVYAVYEACGFGFTLQRQLSALAINCYVVCPQELDEGNKRVKTDGLDAKALCLKLDRFVQGNRDALAIVRVPTEAEERSRAIHRQREQLVGARKRLESCVTKHGNPRLRAALVELAWRLVRFQPNYKPVIKWRQILAKGALATGAARKKAIVAVARQLAVDLWRVRTGRCKPEVLGLEI